MRDAACVGTNPDRFFGDGLGGPVSLNELPCAGCCVSSACADYAEARGLVGVWGGRHLGPRARLVARRRV
ncbi:WhiB family transcriptional regulator [Nocardioides sp. Root79]|uniref:WhiB family transcriptional regulator n=1 Tax=unclassified Nocardioides TaxID=2615069 RepID=UPI0009EC6598